MLRYAATVRIVALLAVRNEELYLARCLQHLLDEGVEAHIIDNDSTDATWEIAQEFARRGGVSVERFPYPGVYPWEALLRRKEQLAAQLPAHWFIHHDADEIRQAPAPFTTLAEGIAHADATGYNAIDFAELVFTPTTAQESFAGRDYVAEMRHYYHFAPRPQHRVNAWKKTSQQVDLTSAAGHQVHFPGRTLYPQQFFLRHYIFLSFEQLCAKYGDRRYHPEEVARGWHGRRAAFSPQEVRFPPRERWRWLGDDGTFDLSDPWTEHFFFPKGPPRSTP